jgi:hypothetical protein
MAGRGRASSQKRHKEQLRLEKRQEKAAKKLDRQTTGRRGPSDEDDHHIAEGDDVFSIDVDAEEAETETSR